MPNLFLFFKCGRITKSWISSMVNPCGGWVSLKPDGPVSLVVGLINWEVTLGIPKL